MRTKSVIVSGKEITIRELKIKELNKLIEDMGGDIEGLLGANSATDLKTTLLSLLYDKLPLVFVQLTKEDIDEAYPSELEALVGGFIDANFLGLKRVVTQVLALLQKR